MDDVWTWLVAERLALRMSRRGSLVDGLVHGGATLGELCRGRGVLAAGGGDSRQGGLAWLLASVDALAVGRRRGGEEGATDGGARS